MDIEERRQALTQKTFRLMLRVLFIFGIPAFIAYFLGDWVDTNYDVGSNGTLICLIVAFLLSWTLVIRMHMRLRREFQALDKEERDASKKEDPKDAPDA
ncbi:MAG: AtpZ/AtpI family protein [Candidatus Magasanikbacteria bacterium]|jgi:hypothetical protein|nr:AtpZ/AtpI family protein [Candidatus Magasanikbacteria bacterium]MBT4221381.1 AtpZ/AtpI family protein [Candidatus Magasanikbacteria bacterium]MBT4350771.1 AtpZ/AtpI family protein [Candidatus Magasanikbacteria bacterium]MBT4541553.1 AtpZ/AtpI family protein [Candidatus Magasanikbacteria bacterium]MBT6253505.1 AtpZ/AtpI family protein [Candidatus Magasanikbacteria bacterium]